MRPAAASMALALAALAAFAPGAAERALACSIGPGSLESSAEYADLIIVGEVVAEEPGGPYDTYSSTIRVAATFRGETDEMLRLENLGYLGADCSGGPRLPEGERVLLFLIHYRSPSEPAVTPETGPLQPAGWENGKYALQDGNFVSRYAQPASYPYWDAVQRVAAITNAPQDEIDAALAFAGGTTRATDEPSTPAEAVDRDGGDDARDWVAPVLAGGAAMLLATAFGAWFLVRRGG